MKHLLLFVLLWGNTAFLYSQLEFTSVKFGTNSDYIATTWNPSFGAAQDFSIEFAMRSSGWSSDPAIVSDKDWNSGKNAGFNIALASNGQGIDVNIADGTNRADLEAGTVNDGQWHHILVTFDRDGLLTLYIDNQFAQSTSMANVGNVDSPFNFNIGQDGTGTYSEAATCEVVNLRAWNRVMTPAELAGVTCTFVDAGFPYILNLIHYWPMVEGAGTSVTDEIGGNNGTFVGNTQWSSGNVPVLEVNYDYSVASSIITFENLCVDATYYFWDFGDGNTSNAFEPSHTYLNPGIYEVKLKAGNACQEITFVQTITISNVGNLDPFTAAELCSTSRLDYIATPFDPQFGTDQDFTVEFRMRSFGWDGDPAIVSDKDWDSGGNPGFVIALNGNSIKVNVGSGGPRTDVNGSKPLDDGQWHHVLASFDRDGDLSLWFDGDLEGARSMAAILDINSPFNLNIGQDGTGAYSESYSLFGCTAEISELRIWNKVLTPADVPQCDTLSNSDPLWNDLLHYWKLNEGIDTIAYDSKGNADGNWVNQESWTDGNLFPAPGANFEENILLSTVEFVNLSTPGTYSWDFGDGETSSLENPSHTYLATGAYNVVLIVSNACAADTLVRVVQVNELNTNLLTALDFDGQNDLVQLNNDLNFGTNVDFTLELFVRSNGWTSDPAILSNKDWNGGSNKGFVIAGRGDGTTWKFNIGDGSNRIDINGDTINDGLWHHIAVTFDRDGAKNLYQDGRLLATNNTAFLGDVNTALALGIGQDGTLNYSEWFKGQVADVRIWNVALDSLTLAQNLCEVTPNHPFYANLLHYWKGNEGQGTAVSDSKGSLTGAYNGVWNVSLNNLPGCDAGIPTNNVGAGNALDFDGFDDHVSVSKNPILEIAQNITCEGWVYARSLQQWESFLNYCQDNGSNESGFDFAYVDGALRFRLTTVDMSGNDWNDNPGFDIPLNEWVHVAGTYDGSVIKMYVNGQLAQQENKTGVIDWEFKPVEMRIGGYIDDNELYYWDGRVDEVRVWNVARSEDEIRQGMCRRMTGNENGLVSYYRLDERTGTTVYDLSANLFHGEMGDMVPAQDRVVSGAGIGDTSVYVYNADLGNTTLAYNAPGQSAIEVSGISGQAAGMQLYVVNNAPANSSSIELVPGTSVHYGVVPARSTGVNYDVVLAYGGNANAEGQEDALYIATRKNAEGTLWTNAVADLNTTLNNLTKNELSGRKELVLALADPNACPFIGQIDQTDTSFSTATLAWLTAGIGAHLEWGPVGFELSKGQDEGLVTSPFTVDSLTANTRYDAYFQVLCGTDAQGNDSLSTWVGPFTFSTAVCLPPSGLMVDAGANSVSFNWDASSNATAYTIEWGPAGFPQGLGILIQNIDNSPYVLNGLPPNTSFDYYVRSTCGTAGVSAWVGPFNFKTGTIATGEPGSAAALQVYPNPTNGSFFVQLELNGAADVQAVLYNSLGEAVARRELALSGGGVQTVPFEVRSLSAGLYTLHVQAGGLNWSKVLVIE